MNRWGSLVSKAYSSWQEIQPANQRTGHLKWQESGTKSRAIVKRTVELTDQQVSSQQREGSRELRETATGISLATTPIHYLQAVKTKGKQNLESESKCQSSW